MMQGNRKKLLPALLLLGMTLCLAMQAQARKPPEFPAPPKARVSWIGQDVAVNGIGMAVRQFNTRSPIDKVTDFYRNEWREGEDDGPGYTETTAMSPWYLMTRVEEGYLMTAQYMTADDGGTWGYLAISKLIALFQDHVGNTGHTIKNLS